MQDNIDSIFNTLSALCPGHSVVWPNEAIKSESKKLWMITFAEEGVSDYEQIEKGLNKLRRSGKTSVPTAIDFCRLCKPTPEELGCPNTNKAYLEAAKHAHPHADKTWSHPAVKHAFDEIGRRAFELETPARMRDKFEKVYKQSIELAINNQLPPLPELTKPTEEPANEIKDSKKSGEAALKEIKAMLAGKPSKHKRCVETLLRPISQATKTSISEIEAKFISPQDKKDIEDGKIGFRESMDHVKLWVKDGKPYCLG